MTTETLNIINVISQATAAVAAVFGLGFVGWQIMQARKGTDLQTLQSFLREVKEYEGAFSETSNKDQAFIEFLNFLEIYCLALNDNLISKVSKRCISEKIRDSIALISNIPEWESKMMSAVTSQDTFTGLQKFMVKNKAKIAALSETYKIESE